MFPVIKNREKKRYAKILEKSIEQKEFRFMYQPIVNTNGNGIGLEMLVRWQHKGKWISPLAFIPIIEEYQLISAFNKLLVDQLVIDWHTFKEKLQNVSFISINVSPYIFVYNEETAFIEYLVEQLKANGISPAEICLEITETNMLTESAFEFLGECRQKGFLIAIDDFGSGYSSFEYLIEKSFNLIKLDMSLIRQITTNPRKVAIVEAILLLAKNLNFRVVAEGVETAEQYELLKAMGVSDIQGYFISKPAFIEDIC